MLDPANLVVQLCTQGMQAEAEQRHNDAAAFFAQAWDAATNHTEECIAAHYIARHQPTAEATLQWNARSLELARKADTDDIGEFFPSLLLNVAHSYEMTGNRNEAARHYAEANAHVGILPDGPYADIVRRGIAEGMKRVIENI